MRRLYRSKPCTLYLNIMQYTNQPVQSTKDTQHLGHLLRSIYRKIIYVKQGQATTNDKSEYGRFSTIYALPDLHTYKNTNCQITANDDGFG